MLRTRLKYFQAVTGCLVLLILQIGLVFGGIEENSIHVNSEENNVFANHTSTVQPSTTVVPDNSVPSAALAKCECLATEENTSNVEPNPSTENTSNEQPDPSDICLTEECVLAASTVLSSLNRNADPCEDFYEYACGGWIQNSVTTNTDRFTVVDKRNQNDIRKMLEMPEEPGGDSSAESKAKSFYRSCLNVSADHEKVNLANLLDIIDKAGGWHLTGDFHPEVDIDERIRRLQNDFGVDVLFTWGIIEQEGKNRMALVAGGWNDALLVEEGDQSEYLKLMTMYTMLLAQAEEESVTLDLSDLVEASQESIESINTTIEIYDYEEMSENEIDTMFKQEKTPSDQENNNSSVESSIILSAIANETVVPHANGLSDSDDNKENDESPFNSNLFPSFEDNIKSLLEQRANMEAALSDVIQFEEALGNITDKPMDSNNLVSVKIAQLAKDFPFMNWTIFFQSAFNAIDDTFSINQDTEILIQEKFVKGVHQLVTQYLSDGRQKVLQNYMIWRVVASFYPDQPSEEYHRRESCLKQTEDVFSPVVTSMYIRSKGVGKSEVAVEQVTMMVEAMQEAFRENLSYIKWMSPASADAAKAKLEHMADLIGFPNFVLNSTWLDQVFQDLPISQDHYLKNVANHRSFARQMELRDYFRSPKRGSWNDFSHMANIATVNAYYNQVTNTMVVPIGMLQPPLFWSKPKSLTFGAFGIVVAHEITHAFDEVGIMYNSEGLFQPLYDNETIEAFNNASDCIRKQYSTFSAAGVNVDGNATMGENIADHGGLKIAEIAYENWLRQNNGQDTLLPALQDFSPFQLFYLGYALPWCAIHTEAMLKSHVMKDEHAPDKFRVRGPLSNSQKFAKTWGCPLDRSTMNPSQKCEIWG